MKNAHAVGIILGHMTGSGFDLTGCMDDLIKAIESGDAEGAASAFREAFAGLESEPHGESSGGE